MPFSYKSIWFLLKTIITNIVVYITDFGGKF